MLEVAAQPSATGWEIKWPKSKKQKPTPKSHMHWVVLKITWCLKKKYNLWHSPCLLIFIANLWTRYYSVIKRGNSGSRVAEHVIAGTGPCLRDDLYCLSLPSCLWRTAPVPRLRRGWHATLSVYRKRDLFYKKFMETWGDLGVSIEAVDLWSLLSLHPSPHLYWILLFSGSSLT